MMYRQQLLAILLLLATANAATLAVLEITIADDEVDLTIDETKFLSDELRRQAMRILPKDYTILTREKILAIIPETTENFNSVIDIGIAIKSDYVTRGYIGKVGNLFTLTVELYETTSGKLLGDFIKESTDLKELLNATRENSPELFAKIMPETAEEPQQLTIYKAGLRLGEQPIPTNMPANSKIETSFWVSIGLDVLGAAAIGLGVYNNAKSRSYHRESQSLLENIPDELGQYTKRESEFNSKYKKMQNAETMRNIFYATGGALFLGGVAVHIWF